MGTGLFVKQWVDKERFDDKATGINWNKEIVCVQKIEFLNSCSV